MESIYHFTNLLSTLMHCIFAFHFYRMNLSHQKNLDPLLMLLDMSFNHCIKKARNLKMQTPQETMKSRCCYFQLKFQLRKINTFISSLSREGLWAPNSWLVQIAEITELCFQRQTKLSKPTSLPVDKVVEDVLLPH